MTPGAYFCVRVIDLLPTHIKMSLDFSQINSNLKKKWKKKFLLKSSNVPTLDYVALLKKSN